MAALEHGATGALLFFTRELRPSTPRLTRRRPTPIPVFLLDARKEVADDVGGCLEDPRGAIGAAAGSQRLVGGHLDGDGALDEWTHRSMVLEEVGPLLRIVARLVVHVADGDDGRLLGDLPAASGDDARGKREQHGDAENGHWTSSSWTSSRCDGEVDSSRARVVSRSNFGSCTSMEMKNLSSEAAAKRSDSKIG